MSHLYYGGLRLSAYAVIMQNSSFVVKSDVDRWGQRIAPSVSAWVKVSSKDTGGAWSMVSGDAGRIHLRSGRGAAWHDAGDEHSGAENGSAPLSEYRILDREGAHSR